jgi:tape measure domain-containing protein
MAGRFTIEGVFKGVDQMSAVTRKIGRGMSFIADRASAGLTKVDKINNQILGKLGSVGTAVAASAAVATVGVIGIGAALGKSSVDAMAFREDTLRALTLLTKDADKAGAAFTDALNLSDRLGTGPQDTIQSIQRLMAKGFGEAQAIETFSGLADLKVVIPTANLENAVLAIEQIKSKGVLQMEELQGQLAEAGLNVSNVLEAIGKKIGKSQKEVRQMISGGKISADVGIAGILGSIKSLTGKELGQVSEEASHGISGMLARFQHLPERFFIALASKFDASPLKARLAQLWDKITPGGTPFEGAIELANRALNGFVDGIDRAIDIVKAFRETGVPIMTAFGAGARDGFNEAAAAVQRLLPSLNGLSIFSTEGRDWVETARDFGSALGKIVVYSSGFLVFAAAVKTAQAALYSYELAGKAADKALTAINKAMTLYTTVTESAVAKSIAMKGAEYASAAATWARNAAVSVGTLFTRRFSAATIFDSAKTVINTGLTWARQAAQWAWNTATGLGAGIARGFTVATITSSAKTAWDTVVTGLRAAAQWGLNSALGVGVRASRLWAIATGQGAAATVAAEASMAPFVATVGAAALAIGSVYMAWKQLSSLLDSTGGWGGIGAGVKSLVNGDGFFAGVDKHLNEQAKTQPLADAASPALPASVNSMLDSTPDFEQLLRQQQMLQSAFGGRPDEAHAPSDRELPDAPIGSLSSRGAESDSADLRELIAVLKQNAKTPTEITIKDKSGSAEVTRQGAGTSLKVDRTGTL